MNSEYTSASNTGSARVVEIATIPRMFYTPAYGAPDMLSHSTLTSAREA